VTIAAGEFQEARRLAKRAITLNSQQPLNLLLSAQSAYMSGKFDESNAHFLQMSKNTETAFLGLRGLILQAHHTNNWEQMPPIAPRSHDDASKITLGSSTIAGSLICA